MQKKSQYAQAVAWHGEQETKKSERAVREFVPMTRSPMSDEVAKRIAIYRSYPSKQP